MEIPVQSAWVGFAFGNRHGHPLSSAAWTANKTAGNLTALSAAVNAFAAGVNAQVLAANKVANTDQVELLYIVAYANFTRCVKQLMGDRK